MPRKRPKSLDAPVVMQARRLEAWAYLRCDQWKKQYRYTLVNDFRCHITAAKNEIIRAFELPNRFKNEKLYHYSQSQVELALTESCMDIMIMDEFGIMNEKEWAQAAIQIDDIRMGLSRLASSLTKGVGGSESPELAMGSVSANYKDV
jgi:hypothetical protein